MAALKPYFVLLVLLSTLIGFVSVRADEDGPIAEESRSDAVDSSSLKIEVDQLKSKINLLETRVDESRKDLKSKDETIKELEKVIQEKSNGIVSLQSEIVSLQKKGSSDVEERVGKAHARAAELEKQVDQLKKDIESQNKKKNKLEARADEAEKKIQEMNLKMEKLQKINEEQKAKIHKTERALQVAEEEMMKAKFEVTSRTKELLEVHGSWLPPWLEHHAIRWQSIIVSEWNEHGHPVMEIVIQKILEKKAQTEKWAKPHIENMKAKWIPAVKEQWLMMIEYLQPHVQALTAKSAETYKILKSTIKSHALKAQELVDPYYQEVVEFSKPYVDQVATMAKPHVEKAHIALKPHAEKAVHAYRKFLESATTYHHQVQAVVHEKLKDHEVTRALATKEFVWFVASALLALPIILLSRICGAMFLKKPPRPHHGAHPHHHGRRKGKRGHADK